MTRTYDIPIHLRIRELQKQIHAEWTRNHYRHNWTKIRELTRQRDELQDQVRINAPRNMFAMPHTMLLDAIDLVHAEALKYTTSGLQWVVKDTFGIRPSRRTSAGGSRTGSAAPSRARATVSASVTRRSRRTSRSSASRPSR